VARVGSNDAGGGVVHELPVAVVAEGVELAGRNAAAAAGRRVSTVLTMRAVSARRNSARTVRTPTDRYSMRSFCICAILSQRGEQSLRASERSRYLPVNLA
jgi:hypothetical protein